MAGNGVSAEGPSPAGKWLRRWGTNSWLFLGLFGAIVVLWLTYSKAHEVVLPLIIAFIIGILLQPLVDSMTRHHLPRWLAVVITMILIVAIAAGILTVFIYGIVSQAGSIEKQVSAGVNKIRSWLDNLKVSESVHNFVNDSIAKAWPSIANGLVSAVTKSVPGIASFAIGIFIAFFILIFFLGDDGKIMEWVANHMGVARSKADIILDGVSASIRGYFRGTLIIATVDSLLFIPLVLILKVPLLWPIVLVTFVTCFIPSFGGYIGGAFAVFITLASKGLAAGLIMLVYAILVHTIMQNPVQALAYGKTLQLHPLVALLATLLGTVFFGIAGAILAAPITAVVLKVSSEIRKAREGDEPGNSGVAPAEEPA